MRMSRLADLFEHKYDGSVVKTAASPAEVFAEIKDRILNNYKHWVMGKYRALKILAEANEPHAKSLYDVYNDLVANIDSYSPVQVFNRVNKILGLIKGMKDNPEGYRNSIHDSVEINRDSDKNYREQLKGGFETNLKRISFGLAEVAKTLRAFVPGAEISGGAVDAQRKDVSRERLLIFMKGPIAHFLGLNELDVMTTALADPELKEDIITLVNGGKPRDPQFRDKIKQIKSLIEQRKTNLPALEQMPEKPAEPASLFEDEEEKSK
jgi:uncharacterized phage infection (PIP) family protein YhgE